MRKRVAKSLRWVADRLDKPTGQQKARLSAVSERIADVPQPAAVTDGVSLQRPNERVGRYVPGDNPPDEGGPGGGAWLRGPGGTYL